ncbi:MAG: phosphohistidine phosphatase SixA [Mariprofundales bacterium]|nr:phosphohistidine phosphatase SixA [Mariprofundales bacterium]
MAQHGEARDQSADSTRPLSAQGREDIARVAGFLSLFTKPQPRVIYSSEKTRAQQSAAMFAEGWNIPRVAISDALSPLADPSIWQRRLEQGADAVMLVSHLPLLSQLASHLLLGHGDGAPIRFANGGVVCLAREETGWQVCWQVNPKQLYR